MDDDTLVADPTAPQFFLTDVESPDPMQAKSTQGFRISETGLASLVANFSEDFQPFLLSLLARHTAEMLISWASHIDEPEMQRMLVSCAEQKREVVRRLEALFAESLPIETEILQEVPQVLSILQNLSQQRIAEGLQLQIETARICQLALQSLANRENHEQARHLLISCAVLEEKIAQRIAVALEEVPCL